VELAQLKVGQARGSDDLVPLDQEQVAVVGAGRMARLLLQHLRSKGCRGAVLLNRTVARAEAMAADFPDLPIQCRPLEDLDHCLSTCSLVFTSTGTEQPIITADRLGGLNRRSSLMLIDIGVPRNITADVAALPGVDYFDVDDLQEVVARNQEARRELASEAESLLQEEARHFLEWWDGLEAVPLVNRLRRQMEDIREQELQKALSRMGPDLSARERKVVEALSKGIINKVLHTPVTRLRSPQPRQQRHQAMKVIEELFELHGSPLDGSTPTLPLN
jgi:glutamyl-tRNA reductase